ncbi:hypothetical protein BGZ52_008377 [Haplosporangium bisporale]|nr:hypothetical protein BGZ52_008377 [Haplosporangium bisporale]
MLSSEEYTEDPHDTLQKFESRDHPRFSSLPTYLCPETNERYILWSDIQGTFLNVSYLQTYEGRAMFMIDRHGELHQPLRIKFSEVPYTYLIDHLETIANSDRYTLRQATANAWYYYSMARKRLETLDQDRIKALVDGKDRESLLRQLGELEQQMSMLEYRNTCRNMLHGKVCRWEYATSSLFIVLPSDLRSWDDSVSATHKFRLYFLCDIRKMESASKEWPQHVHLSNHPGYNLEQPLEFFKIYGDYALRMLRMIKHGYSDDLCEIPPLNTSKILLNCDPYIFGNHLTHDTIQSLVDKALLYLIRLAPPKSIMEPGLTRNQSAAIEAYLDLQEGRPEGLHRCINQSQDVSWMCRHHKQQSFGHGSQLALLENFVRNHGGLIDMQQATLRVELSSPNEMDQFSAYLTSTNYIFDLSIKLNWKPSRRWVELRSDLEAFGSQLMEAQVAADCTTAVNELQAAFKKYGLPAKTTVTIYKSLWRAVVDLQRGVIVEVYSQDLGCPRPLLSLNSVQTLTVDRTIAEFDQELGHIIQANKEMSELNISTKGRNVLYEAERIARLRRHALRPLCLTLFDRTQDYRGRMVAQVDVGGGNFRTHDIEDDLAEPELLCTLKS